jgi:hypothetical protein
MKRKLLLFVFLFVLKILHGQEEFTISGYIKDSRTGEELIAATIYVEELQKGTITNVYGFYSLTIPKGNYTLRFNFLGYNQFKRTVELDADKTIDIELQAKSEQLKEVVIEGQRKNRNVENIEMSVEKMQMKLVKKLPAFFGETDVIKTLQLLPGIQSGGEGSSGLYVRGGGPDQNLLLLDEAPVYNASHLLGFFSVFNSDAIKDLKIYKGGIPAQFGGKASSVIDIRMKEGNMKKFSGKGAVSNLSSRLTLEGPIIPDRWSYIISARRTYADIVGRLAGIDELQDNDLYFYDLNAKTNYIINDKNRIFISGYTGDDNLALGESLYMRWGNWTTTFRWNHLFSSKLFSNFTALYAKYDYNLGVPGDGGDAFDWKSHIRDVNVKLDFTYYHNPSNTIKFGWNSIYHDFIPGESTGFLEGKITAVNALEHALYASNEHKIGKRLTLRYGLRSILFQHVGEGTVYDYVDPDNPSDFTITDTTNYEKWDNIQDFIDLEPRFSAKYSLKNNSSVKMSYNRMIQNLHLISNTNSPTPFDIWLPSSKYIKPLIVNQIALGYFRNFRENTYEASAEVYYKDIKNQIDYKDGAELFLNPNIETELLRGDAYSYGLELLLKKQEGRFTGWISYTYARVLNKIPGINDGKEYPSSYERKHDVSFIATYNLNDRWSFSANWVFASGNPTSYPETKYLIQGNTIRHFSERNAYRIPDYHRLDISATMEINPGSKKRYKHSLNFSVYNLYGRRNAYSVTFQENEDNPAVMEANRLSIVGAQIPSITYLFNF